MKQSDPVTLAVIATVPSLACGAPFAWTVRNPTVNAYERTPVRLKLPVPEADFVVTADDVVVPYQVTLTDRGSVIVVQ